MNILFFYRVYPNYGGVEVVTSVLAKRFVEDGHQVTIASLEQPHPELKDQNIDGIELVTLHHPVLAKDNVARLHQVIVDKKIDIIVNQWGLPYKTTILCNKAIKGTNCKLVSVLHGAPNISKVIIKAQDKVKNVTNPISKLVYSSILKAKEEVIKWSIRYACKHNEKYIMLSNAFIEPLIKYARIKDSANITAIGNPVTIPVDLSGFDLKNKKKQILYVGRMDFENKRVNRIVEAWEGIADRHKDWELVLVGNGPHKSLLQEYVAQHHIDRVRFEGFQVEAPIRYYKDASIFMLTSDLEGFGLVIIESMSFGCVPIVYGSYEAVYDIIEHGKSGFITPMPYSKSKTMEYMEQLIENENLRNDMAKNAMTRSKLFSIDSIAKKWYDLFDEVLKHHHQKYK